MGGGGGDIAVVALLCVVGMSDGMEGPRRLPPLCQRVAVDTALLEVRPQLTNNRMALAKGLRVVRNSLQICSLLGDGVDVCQGGVDHGGKVVIATRETWVEIVELEFERLGRGRGDSHVFRLKACLCETMEAMAIVNILGCGRSEVLLDADNSHG